MAKAIQAQFGGKCKCGATVTASDWISYEKGAGVVGCLACGGVQIPRGVPSKGSKAQAWRFDPGTTEGQVRRHRLADLALAQISLEAARALGLNEKIVASRESNLAEATDALKVARVRYSDADMRAARAAAIRSSVASTRDLIENADDETAVAKFQRYLDFYATLAA